MAYISWIKQVIAVGSVEYCNQDGTNKLIEWR